MQPETPHVQRGRSIAAATAGRLEVVAVLTAMGIALGLGVHGLTREFSYDELFSAHWFIADADSWRDTVASYIVYNNHILFSILSRLSWLLLGAGPHQGGPEWVLRLPALLCGVASVYFVWYCGRDWVGRGAAVLASYFLAILPTHVLWSQSARGNTGLMVTGLISSWALFRLLDRPTWSGVAAVVVSGAASIYFHLYGVWIWTVQAMFVMAFTLRRSTGIDRKAVIRAWIALAGIGVVSLLLYLPVVSALLETLSARGQADARPGFPLAVVRELLGVDGVRLALVLGLVVLGALAGSPRRWRTASYSVALLIVPVAGMWLVVKPADIFTRYFSYWVPYAMLLLASGVLVVGRTARFAPRLLRPIALGAAASVTAVIAAAWLAQSAAPFQPAGYRAAMVALDQEAPGDLHACAFGADPELFSFYRDGLQVLHSQDEYDQFMAGAVDFGCVYHDLPWSPQWSQALAARLTGTSTIRTFASVTVFRGRSPNWRLFNGEGTEYLDLVPQFDDARKDGGTFTVVQATLEGVTRKAIATPRNGRLHLRARIPKDGWLTMSVGMMPESWSTDGHEVHFFAGVSAGDTYKTLFTRTLRPFANAAERQWIPVAINLAEYADRDVEILLNTRDVGATALSDGVALWGAPSIVRSQ